MGIIYTASSKYINICIYFSLMLKQSSRTPVLLQGHSKIPILCPKMYPLSLSAGWYELSDPCKVFSRDNKAETEQKTNDCAQFTPPAFP